MNDQRDCCKAHLPFSVADLRFAIDLFGVRVADLLSGSSRLIVALIFSEWRTETFGTGQSDFHVQFSILFDGVN